MYHVTGEIARFIAFVIQHFMKRLLMHDAVKYVLAESTYFTEIQ